MSRWSRLFGSKPKSDFERFEQAYKALVGALCNRAFPNEPPLADLTDEQFGDRLRRATELLQPMPGTVSRLTSQQLMDAAAVAAINLQRVTAEPEVEANARIAQVILKFNLTHLVESDAAHGETRVLNLVSDDYQQLVQDAEEGRNRPSETDELICLTEEALEWGRAHGWPPKADFPQHASLRCIGLALHQRGGLREMQRAALHVCASDPENDMLRIELAQHWSGVGDWRD
jgi:hypothetical protein